MARRLRSIPTRPVTLVVPAAAGGTTDIVARLIAEGMTKELGQQFIVDNKGGASGNIGIRTVARAEPDGYTLLLTFSGYQVTNPALFKKLDWDPIESFVPVALTAKSPFLIVARKDLPANTLQEFIAYAKEKPGEVTYASSGQGSLQQIGAEQLQQLTGTKMVHVPYKGAGPAMIDLLGGVVDIYITSPPSAAGHLKNGGVKGLAMAAPERHPMLPDIPTTAEAGVPGLELVSWYAVYAPDRHAARHRRQARWCHGEGRDQRRTTSRRSWSRGPTPPSWAPRSWASSPRPSSPIGGRSSRRPASPSTSDEACADHDQTAGAP